MSGTSSTVGAGVPFAVLNPRMDQQRPNEQPASFPIYVVEGRIMLTEGEAVRAAEVGARFSERSVDVEVGTFNPVDLKHVRTVTQTEAEAAFQAREKELATYAADEARAARQRAYDELDLLPDGEPDDRIWFVDGEPVADENEAIKRANKKALETEANVELRGAAYVLDDLGTTVTKYTAKADGFKLGRNRRKRKPVSGEVMDCANVGSSKVVTTFLRSLSPKEKGFALRVLLDLAKQTQAK